MSKKGYQLQQFILTFVLLLTTLVLVGCGEAVEHNLPSRRPAPSALMDDGIIKEQLPEQPIDQSENFLIGSWKLLSARVDIFESKSGKIPVQTIEGETQDYKKLDLSPVLVIREDGSSENVIFEYDSNEELPSRFQIVHETSKYDFERINFSRTQLGQLESLGYFFEEIKNLSGDFFFLNQRFENPRVVLKTIGKVESAFSDLLKLTLTTEYEDRSNQRYLRQIKNIQYKKIEEQNIALEIAPLLKASNP